LQLVEAFGRAAGEDEVVTALPEQLCDRRADAAGRPRDQIRAHGAPFSSIPTPVDARGGPRVREVGRRSVTLGAAPADTVWPAVRRGVAGGEPLWPSVRAVPRSGGRGRAGGQRGSKLGRSTRVAPAIRAVASTQPVATSP